MARTAAVMVAAVLGGVVMDSYAALKVAEKLWPRRLLACGEYMEPPTCRVEEVRRGGPWNLLAAGPTWEELFRNASRKVTVQQSLL